MNISQKAIDLILDFEVGDHTGQYFNKFLKSPEWPGESSGVTVCIGIDLGYYTETEYQQMFWDLLSNEDYTLLKTALGKKGESAKSILSKYKKISFEWDQALMIFNNYTLPKFYNLTIKTFPKADQLHPDATGGLVSLVFNRGSSLKGDSRKEMRSIVNLINKKDYDGIADEIVSMKRLWPNNKGLKRRRDAEADMIRGCA